MKHGMKLGLMVAVLALGWAVAAQAGPLKFEHIAADAQWLAHVDVDAMKASPVTKDFCEDCLMDWPAAREELKEFREKWGISLCKGLHGILLYGTKIAPEHGVMILQADVDKQAVIDQLKKVVCPETSKHDEHTIYTWTKFKGTKYAKEVAMAFFKPDTMVFASSVDLLKTALDVLEGKAPSLAGKESPLTATIPDGTIFLARADGLENAEMKGDFPVFKLLRQFNYVEGQHEGRWFAELHVTAESEAVANQLKEVYQGHLTLLKLHFHDQPGVVKLIDQIQLKVDGNVARLAFEAPVEQVAGETSAFCKAMKEHWKWHMMMCEKMMYMKHMDKKMEKKMDHDGPKQHEM